MGLDPLTILNIFGGRFFGIFAAGKISVSLSLSLSLFKLGFTPCKVEEPLRGIELQEKEA